MSETLLIILVILVISIGFGLPGYLGVLLYRRYKKSCESKLESIPLSYQQPGNEGSMYNVTFHTYYGFLFSVIQTKHTIPFDPANVEPTINLLIALRNFNFKRGLFAYGGLFVPVLSYFEYKKAIKTLCVHQR